MAQIGTQINPKDSSFLENKKKMVGLMFQKTFGNFKAKNILLLSGINEIPSKKKKK